MATLNQNIILTREDGWDIEELPQIQEIIDEHDNLGSLIYELKHCVRKTDIQDIKNQIEYMANTYLDIAERIDDELEIQDVPVENLCEWCGEIKEENSKITMCQPCDMEHRERKQNDKTKIM